MAILTDKSVFIEIDDNLIRKVDNFIDLIITSGWISHCKNCHKCNNFYDRIKTISNCDWFIKIDNIWYKMNFLNLNQIGNGNSVFLTGGYGIFNLDDIELLSIDKYTYTQLHRNYHIDCLGI